MEGYQECFECRTSEPWPEEKFLETINPCLPAGIRFLAWKQVALNAPSLSQRLKAAVYSLDLVRPEVIEVWSKKRGAQANGHHILINWLKEKIGELKNNLVEGANVWLNSVPAKLYFCLPLFSADCRPQDFLEQKLGLEGMAFYLAREKFIFHEEN